MRNLTCYAWGKPGDWEALCVDLDIATQGGSFEEVKRDLELAVEDFLDYAAELPELDRKSVLSYRTPWLLRMRLALQYRCSVTVAAFHSLMTSRPAGTVGKVQRAEFSIGHAS